MKSYSFEVAHGYQILFGCVTADTKEEAEKKILNEGWDDIIDGKIKNKKTVLLKEAKKYLYAKI